MIINFYKKNENLILILFAYLHLILSTISNYGTASYIIKFSSLFFLSTLILLNTNFNISIYISRSFGKILFLLILFLLIFSVSLFYSKNRAFGIEKIIHFLLGPFFMVIVIYFISQIMKNADFKSFTAIIAVLLIVSVLIAAVVNPFDFSEKYYQFRIGNWSHIIFGIFIALTLLLILFSYINETNLKYNFLYSAALFTGIYGLYASIPRGSIIALSVTSVIFILYNIIKFKQKNIFIKIIIPIAISLILMLIFQREIKGPEKSIQKVFSVLTDKGYGDISIQSRLMAYEISIKMIKDSPLTGVGFGGFKSFYESEFPIELEYPHNIFLEFQTETGISGSVLFVLLLVISLKKIKKNNIMVFSVFLFGFIYALFSKDIPSNTIIFVSIFYALSDNHIMN